MSLLPAKFQTPTPAALGAKVVAITPAPAPHVHQWMAVPDSKVHSRCAGCGAVTLTEAVAPRMIGFDLAVPSADLTSVFTWARGAADRSVFVWTRGALAAP